MSGTQPPPEQLRSTPEERSNVQESDNPIDATPKFEVENVAWLRLGKKSPEVTIAARKKDENGKFVYQVKGKDGVLYKKGEWVRQEKLDEAA